MSMSSLNACRLDEWCSIGGKHNGRCPVFWHHAGRRVKIECDGTRAETRFGLPAKRTSPFISAGVSVQSAAGSRGVRISGRNAGYSARLLATHSIRLFPLHFSSRASPCATKFRFHSTNVSEEVLSFPTALVPVIASYPGSIKHVLQLDK